MVFMFIWNTFKEGRFDAKLVSSLQERKRVVLILERYRQQYGNIMGIF